MHYLTRHTGTRRTPQSQPIPGTDQVPNSAGGFAWAVDDWTRLDRFLILGSEGGTYYIGERKLTQGSAEAARRCILADGPRVVRRVIEISEAGRAPKNDPALFVLAMASALGDAGTRQAAFEAVPRVARIGTHLFHFLDFRQAFAGWGRGMRRAVSAWYDARDLDAAAYQMIKYRQRDGWTHRDVLRQAHPHPDDPARGALYAWVTGKEADHALPRIVEGFQKAQTAESPKETAALVTEYGLPREALQPEHLTDVAVWDALLDGMPMTALIRNLATMTRIGLLTPLSDAAARAVAQIGDEVRLRKARTHPIAVLSALRTYASGQSVRGSSTWEPVSQITDALDGAFYSAFANIEPTGKRIVLALDVSSSMARGEVAGSPGLAPREGSAAMALVTAATEPQYAIMGFSHTFEPLAISPRQRLDDAVRAVSDLNFGGTDCALPMLWAIEKGIEVDAFVVYTDSETWAGHIHPVQALQRYRRETNILAKLIVVGMEGNNFSIANPEDAGMLDVVGFDAAAPALISDFIR